MLGLGLGGFECAGKNGDLGILDVLGHLRVTESLVDDNTLDQHGVFETSTNLSAQLDQIEVDVLNKNKKSAKGRQWIEEEGTERRERGRDTFLSRSATETTALTAISAIFLWYLLITLDPKVVIAVSIRGSTFLGLHSILSEIVSKCLTAKAQAVSYPRAMRIGWILRERL